MDEALLLAGPSPDTGRAHTAEEFELRERLRLEALERRSRSLRSSPVAQTYRQLDRGSSGAAQSEADPPGAIETIRAEGAAALADALGTFQGITGDLENEVAAEREADREFLAALTGAQQGTAPADGQVAPTAPVRDYANPGRLETGDDPPGWERIYEGSFLEAVLVTQLSGDFPGPVLAQVSAPFYSARPATYFSLAWSAGYWNGDGCSRPRSRTPSRELPSVDLPGRTLGCAGISRLESSRGKALLKIRSTDTISRCSRRSGRLA